MSTNTGSMSLSTVRSIPGFGGFMSALPFYAVDGNGMVF